MGPSFSLALYDLNCMRDGKHCLGYRLSSAGKTIFEGSDFYCSPLHAIDSDDCVKALMGFLTLKPGDTDREYFANYTEAQMEFANQHSEALACEIDNRFGDE